VFGYYLLVLGGEGGIFSFGLDNPIDYVNKFFVANYLLIMSTSLS
jgi:hypothetical protein